MNAQVDYSAAYWSICYIGVVPGKMDESGKAFASLQEIAEATKQNEPGALIYRFYKTKDKSEITCIEKFASRDAYATHTSSEHVRAWANKYLKSGLFEGMFEFHAPAEDGPGVGGFDRP